MRAEKAIVKLDYFLHKKTSGKSLVVIYIQTPIWMSLP
jgi:hypothetical protein